MLRGTQEKEGRATALLRIGGVGRIRITMAGRSTE